jgi:DNA-binding MarR family transcriptional regulator
MKKAVRPNPPVSHVRAVRAFNRFYTHRIGVLQRGVLQSPYSLTEVRVLYELANGADLTATEVQGILGLDPGYLSRILRSFERSGLLLRERSKKDGRRNLIRLTTQGRKVFAVLNARQSSDVEKMLLSLPDPARGQLLASMQTIQRVLNGEVVRGSKVSLRTHRPVGRRRTACRMLASPATASDAHRGAAHPSIGGRRVRP